MLTVLLSVSAAILPVFAFQAPESPQNPKPAPVDPEHRSLPLRVEDVARLVLENSPQVRQAHLAALVNAGAIKEEEGAFDPVFTADATYSFAERPNAGGLFTSGGLSNTHNRTWNANQGLRSTLMTGGTLAATLTENFNETNLNTNFFGFNPRSDTTLNLNFTQPLLRGAWFKSATLDLRSAELDYDQGLAQLRETSLSDLQQAIDTYWDLAFARADVEVKEFSLGLAEELKRVTEAKFKVGTAAEVEVVQTEADIANRTDDLLTSRNTVRQTEDQLRILIFHLGEEEEWQFELVPVDKPPPAESTDLAWEAALRVARSNRPVLQRLRLQVEQARLDWDVAQQDTLPLLNFVATGSSLGTKRQVNKAFTPLLQFRSAGYSVGVALEIPLGNRQFRGLEEQARAEYYLAVRQLRDQEIQVSNEVREAVRDLNFQAERVKTTSTSVEVARRALDAETRRLREGASTNFTVLQFQDDLSVALSDEKRARMDYAKAWSRLRTVQGLNLDGSNPWQVDVDQTEIPED